MASMLGASSFPAPKQSPSCHAIPHSVLHLSRSPGFINGSSRSISELSAAEPSSGSASAVTNATRGRSLVLASTTRSSREPRYRTACVGLRNARSRECHIFVRRRRGRKTERRLIRREILQENFSCPSALPIYICPPIHFVASNF